ncbi:MAG: ATP-binding cassette domain-containing protein [Lachnospiraceae bacterium]
MKGAFRGLVKPEYHVIRAVDDIDFTIETGESVGYVGPNGSGKSTTIKMLSGILTPTQGTVHINGLVPTKERMKNNQHIGVVFGNRSQLWWDVPVIESFRLLQKSYEVPQELFDHNLEEFTDILDLKTFLNTPERQLSLGQKMRCNITAAFLHNPEVVYLDEPTIGLDAESKYRIREFIRRINQERKTTFIVTSHDFQDIEALCKRIILINHGKVIMDSNMNQVKKKFNQFKSVKFIIRPKTNIKAEELRLYGVSFKESGPYSIEAEYEVTKTDAMKVIEYVSRYYEVEDVAISGRDIEAIIQDILRQNEGIIGKKALDERCQNV